MSTLYQLPRTRGSNVNAVKCPRCKVHTTNQPMTVKDESSSANPFRVLEPPRFITAKFHLRAGMWSIVECASCGEQFLLVEGKVVWPLASLRAPSDVPEKVKEAYEDARLAHAAGANIAALLAARTALIRFLRNKQASDFKELVDRQVISGALYGGVDQLRLWATVAGHDDIEVDTFDAQEVEDILDYLATALEAAYTHQARVDQYVRRTKELRD